MRLLLFLLILASVCLSAIAQLALKLGVGSAAMSKPQSIGGEMAGLMQSPMVLAGLALYGVGALLWLFVLGRAPLSLAYPFVGLGFIVTMLAGAFYLDENLSPARITGTLLIAFGCFLVAKSA